MRKKIAALAVAGGAALALTAPLATTAQAAPASSITRTSACAQFIGTYTYWSDNTGWYGYRLTGSMTRTCSGSGWHTLEVTGDHKVTGSYERSQSDLLSKGQWVAVTGFSADSSVKNIRIALIDG
ncbi:hypothetical protein [Streptomyces rhizosphaericus]|uniref:Uncharacterized protein n=1 Tax=Streptomyces rhizosphaericus TaxID=114699 RepID=A0A6G4AL09_9ACTN|nr:hypothetical protein [Streptomyces rhizosphaericus]NEW73474.1 hypothetical protein [Streptomyces rhizosphaericus]